MSSTRKIFELISRPFKELSDRNKLLILSLIVGIVSGLGAVVLQELVHGIRHIMTSWFNVASDYLLMLVYPGIGMLLSLLIVKYIVKDNIGHGVTKVLLSLSKNESKIKAHNTWSSILTSSLTIGLGGSVGGEAPIVYTGAALGSNIARWTGMSYRNITILLGCGAAGAIAGIFKAPLAGILFTLEILFFNISMTSIMPLLLSTVSATVVSYVFLGNSLPFECTLAPFSLSNIPFYILLGVLSGLVSLYFIRTSLWLEDRLGKIRNPFLKWIFCSLSLGILIFLFPPLYGEGYTSLSPLLNAGNINFDGQTILASMLHYPWLVPVFFLLILILKVFSMTFTNAGGGVGGTFGPTLFMGAILGFIFARTANMILQSTGMALPEQNFVLVSMAGLMAGVMQAPMTAIFLIAEISGGYSLFVPLIMTSAISFGTVRIWENCSIYTKRIANTGELITHNSDKAVLTLLKTSDLVEKDFYTIDIEDSLGHLVNIISKSHRNIFPVIDKHSYFHGYISLEDVRNDMFSVDLYNTKHVYNYMKTSSTYVYEDERMELVMKKFEQTQAWNLPVVRRDRTYVGFVSKSKIFSAYRNELKVISQD